MLENTILLTIGGVLLGALVNAFADVLPDGLIPRLPKYPDGGRRPFLAWLGISAFLFNLRRQKATDIGTGPEGLSLALSLSRDRGHRPAAPVLS